MSFHPIRSLKHLIGRGPTIGVPEALQKAIDNYGLPAVLTTYDSDIPLILYCNKKHVKLTGYSLDDCIGMSPKMFQGKNTDSSIRSEIRDSLKSSSFWNGRVVNYKKNGEEYRINLIIFGVCHLGTKYYVALKRPEK